MNTKTDWHLNTEKENLINKTATNMGIAASVAGRCNLQLQFAISSGFGGRNSVGLLVVNLYFYFFIGQQFQAGQAMNSTPAAIPARCVPFANFMRFSTYIFVIFLFGCNPNNSKTVFDPLKEKTDIEIYLSDYGLESVPQEIRILKNVKRLYIAKDSSGWVIYPPLSALAQDKSTQPSRYLPNEISELSNLTSLTLVNLDLVSLPENIDRLEKLDTLILYMNKLTISNELEKLKRLRSLKYLGLLGNDLTANDLSELKRTIPGITINPGLR